MIPRLTSPYGMPQGLVVILGSSYRLLLAIFEEKKQPQEMTKLMLFPDLVDKNVFHLSNTQTDQPLQIPQGLAIVLFLLIGDTPGHF